jgi:glycosyltransferase involved in cell wall biosynthesis
VAGPAVGELPAAAEAAAAWPWAGTVDTPPAELPKGLNWPAVSIVIPSLNQGAYLEAALRSVLLQGYPRLEVIVMDGGSTDATLEVIRKYEPWLAHWQSGGDRGPAPALHAGFGHANGEVLGVINADDFYLPGCLAAVAATFALDPGADVVAGHGYFARASGELGRPLFSDAWSVRRFMYGACVLVQQATFFRRSAFERAGGFRQSGSLCWDMELWADLARTGARFRSLDAHIAAFRLHDESITGRASLRGRRQDDARRVMAQMRGRPESGFDRVRHLWHRSVKFARHPGRTIRQRAFVYSALKRWSI